MLPVYDNTGKRYTDVISKVPILVEIQLNDGVRIVGTIHVKPAIRIKDEMNHEEKFIAITDAKLFGSGGDDGGIYRILLINRDQIIWLNPVQENSQDNAE